MNDVVTITCCGKTERMECKKAFQTYLDLMFGKKMCKDIQ